MDPRTRTSLYEGAHGSPLYTAPRKNINPSTSGDRTQEEIAEVTRWMNQRLASAGHTDLLVTDLAIDMADGITLLQLVRTLTKEELPKHYANPIMRIQKLENLQMCVQTLQERGVPVKGIHANDIAGGNVKTILAVCQALKRYFSTAASPKASTNEGPEAMPTSSPPPPPLPGVSSGSEPGRLSFSSLDREDMAVLGWLGDIVHRDITNYSMLYDGKILCDFVNEVKSGAVSEQDIIVGSPQVRLKIAFAAIEAHLYVRPTGVDISRVWTGREDVKLRHYLNTCKSVYRQKVTRRQAEKGGDRGQRAPDRRSAPDMSREEVFESLRNSSGSRMGSLEQKEQSKVEARSLEGIRLQRQSSRQQSESQKGQRAIVGKVGKKQPTLSDSTPHVSSSSPKRLSSSIDNLSLDASRPSTGSKGMFYSSHDHLPVSRRMLHTSPTTRPFSEIYVSGDQSQGQTGQEHKQKTQRLHLSSDLLASPENWELGSEAGRTMRDTTTLSHTASLGLSQSVDRSLQTAATTSSGHGGLSSRKLGSENDVAKSTRSSSGTSFTLPRTKKQSSLTLSSPSSPTPPPLPTVPPPSSVNFNQPTFVPPGGRFSRKPPPYLVSDSDNLASQISDLQDRIVLLSNQLLYEKADVYTRLHRAVMRERKRRQTTEKRLKELEKLAQQLVHHYDTCFVQLAKEVGSLRQEVAQGNRTGEEAAKSRSGTGSGNRLYLTREIDQLKEQLIQLTRKIDINSSHSTLSGSTQTPTESLFVRKRANSDSNVQGPYMRGSALSFKKLSKFFGEEPPRVEDMETFLEGLGYSHLYPTFSVHQISLAELYQMDVSHLEVLGIPLGPRVRIMSELRKLEPFNKQRDS